MQLQEFDFVIRHRQGLKHTNADALSRLPMATASDATGAQLDPPGPRPVAKLPEVIMPDGRVLPGELLVDSFQPSSSQHQVAIAVPNSHTSRQQQPHTSALDCLDAVLAENVAQQVTQEALTAYAASWLGDHVPAIAAEAQFGWKCL